MVYYEETHLKRPLSMNCMVFAIVEIQIDQRNGSRKRRFQFWEGVGPTEKW